MDFRYIHKESEKFEGHFKWLKNYNCEQFDVEQKIATLEAEKKLEPHMTVPILTSMAYLWIQVGKKKDSSNCIEKAMECIKEAEIFKSEAIPYAIKCDLVVKANKLHILLLQRKLSPAQHVLEELEETGAQSTDDSVKASIEGVKAWCLNRLDATCDRSQAIESAKTAVELDESNPHWHALKASMMDKPRYVNGKLSEPKKDVITELRKACELSDWSLAYYVVLYAHLLSQKWYYMDRSDKSALERQCCELIETALALDPHNHEVYRLSSKTYRNIQEWIKSKECLEDGLQNCEEKGHLHLALGRFYLKNRRCRDLNLSKNHFEKTVESGVHKGRTLVSAELELIKINIQLSPEPYDPVNDLVALDLRAREDPANVLKIEIRKVLIDWYVSKGRLEEALAEYLDTVNIEDRSITDRLDVSTMDKIKQLLLEKK